MTNISVETVFRFKCFGGPDAGELVAQGVGERGEQTHDFKVAAVHAALLHRHVPVQTVTKT